jgi:argininosuccinate lyase
MSEKFWGGRFKKKIDKSFDEFQKSIRYDYVLAKYDVYHSLIHIEALYIKGILAKEECSKLSAALKSILNDIEKGKFKPDLDAEDIHSDIQNKVAKKIGKLALKLHSLRSRNDQIVFDEKFYCFIEAKLFIRLLRGVLSALGFLAKKYKFIFIPGYTHTQRAQVVPLKDYLEAFIEMFQRDIDRVSNFLKNLSLYIGSGALAGSAILKRDYIKAIKKILREFNMEEGYFNLGFVKNTLDNVSDRDFIIEFLSILSITQMHLSRLAEDFILYSTKEFHYLDLPEEFCTGSSLMPHKKNPDFLELVRGYTGRVYGNLICILTVMKGLPLTYNRDMQLDKEPLFSSVEIIKSELKIMADFIRGVKLNKEEINKALNDETLYATELGEFLVLKGVVFKEAHNIVGKLMRYAEEKKIKLGDIPDKILNTFHNKLRQKEIKKIMTPKYVVTLRKLR